MLKFRERRYSLIVWALYSYSSMATEDYSLVRAYALWVVTKTAADKRISTSDTKMCYMFTQECLIQGQDAALWKSIKLGML